MPQAHYLFKHALIQDVAYQSLLKSTRQQYHRQIAQVLADRFPETVETQPELVAHHYTQTGLIEQALPYWQQAGERASQRSAYVEAISHLTRGLEVLNTLPVPSAHVQQELALQMALGTSLMMTQGYAAPEVEHAYARALELCGQMGDSRGCFPGLMGLAAFHLARAEIQTARTLMERFFNLAQGTPSPARIVGAHFGLGTILFHLGEFVPGRAHLEQGIALDDPQQSRPAHAMAAPGVECYSLAAVTLWLLGYPEQARKRSGEAFALHQGLAMPFGLAMTLRHAATLQQLLREEQTTRVHAEACMALCREQGFGQVLAGTTVFRGWALAMHGQAIEGIEEMGQGLTTFEATGAKLARPHLLALLAETYGKVGLTAEGLTVLAEALTQVESTGERYYEAELYRLKGELTLQHAHYQAPGTGPKAQRATNLRPLTSTTQSAAEACFLTAMAIARQQQAKSWELRAVMSLSRLWRQQGKKDDARRLLAEIYGWFTEGFDTKDLQEAKGLLEELA